MPRQVLYPAGAAALAAAVLCGLAHGQMLRGRTSQHLDEERTVTVEGNVHPLARAEFEEGTVDGGMRLERMVLALKSPATQQAALDELVAAQQDPESPLFHQWLTPEEFGARLAPRTQRSAWTLTWPRDWDQ